MADRIDERVNTIRPGEYIKMTAELVRAQRDIDKATAELAGARGIKAGVFRRAKSAGVDIEAMKMTLQLESKYDDDDRNRLMENVSKYADWTDVKLWRAPTEAQPQGAMFADDPTAATEHEGLRGARSNSDGWNSRKNGALSDANPFDAGSIEHQQWAIGWNDCDKELDGKPAAPVKASVARKAAKAAEPPKPRGRPRKVPVEAEKEKPKESKASIEARAAKKAAAAAKAAEKAAPPATH